MSFKCAVRGCRMKEKDMGQAWGKKLRISLHFNPKDPVLSRKWKDILLVWNNSLVTDNFHVCSAHFNPENVIVSFGRTHLSPNSVPTIQDSTYLILNYVEKYSQNAEIKTELLEYENVEYLDANNAENINETTYETDPLNLHAVKEEDVSDALDYPNTIEKSGSTNDEDINSRHFEPKMEIEDIFIESKDSENHTEKQCQAIISKPKEENQGIEDGHQRASESFNFPKPMQEARSTAAKLTNFIDCKLKLRRLDRILKILRNQNSRQTLRIMSLQKNLAEIKDELNASNRALALLLEPDFEFADSQSSS